MRKKRIKLIEPTEALCDAYMNFLDDFAQAGEKTTDGAGAQGDPKENFTAYVQKLQDYSVGINIPDGWVPASTFWLVHANEIIGVCNIRHKLTDSLRDFGGHIGYSVRPSQRNKGYATAMLRLALEKARALSIGRALITCDRKNIASARVIQKNGGVLDSESFSEQAGRVTQRYWIYLEPGAKNDVYD